jgi:hypothetical protein
MSLLSSILDSLAEVLAKGQGLYKAQVLENTNTILKRIKGIQREVLGWSNRNQVFGRA